MGTFLVVAFCMVIGVVLCELAHTFESFLSEQRAARAKLEAEEAYTAERDRLRLIAMEHGVGFDEDRSNEINRYRIELAIKMPPRYTLAAELFRQSGVRS